MNLYFKETKRVFTAQQRNLKSSTLPLGHGGSPHYWTFTKFDSKKQNVSSPPCEETFCFFEVGIPEQRAIQQAPARQAGSVSEQVTEGIDRGPGAVVKVACLESRRSRARTPLWHSSSKETKCFFPAHAWRFNIVGSLHYREVAYSASDRQGSYFGSCVWRSVSSHSSHHPQEVLLAQFSLYVHKGGENPIHPVMYTLF